jgi:hypothetical protein
MVWISVGLNLRSASNTDRGMRLTSLCHCSHFKRNAEVTVQRADLQGAPPARRRVHRDTRLPFPWKRSCRQSLWWRFPKAVSHAIERINHVEGIVDCYEFLA